MKLDTIECSFRDNIELNQVVTEEILSQGSKIRIDVQTLSYSRNNEDLYPVETIKLDIQKVCLSSLPPL